ncbi:MAG: hypothetical protein Q9170_004089 [Blastenia crenularia]
MPIRHGNIPRPLGTGLRHGIYELQDIESPTHRSPQRIRHFHDNDYGSDAIGKINGEDTDLESGSSIEGPANWSRAEEVLLVRKFDHRLVSFISFLYLLGFLDRSNIGNAVIAGLSRDLHMNSSQYEWTLRAFYITYVLFEWMPILYTILSPSTYIALCVFAWGVIASLQALSTSYMNLCILRAFLGVSEAAFSPGVPVFLAFFYKREELAYRIGLFISAAPLATSFASSLAWLITKLSQHSSIASWRILFLVEGFPSVVISIFAFYLIPDGPGAARYLTKRERWIAERRLQQQGKAKDHDVHIQKFEWKEIREALEDPKCYLTAVMFCSCNVAFSSLPVFLPTIIEAMGYSALKSQALSAPPYLLAFVVVLLTAFYSDKYQNRSLFICFHALLAASGYAIIVLAGVLEAGWGYWGVYLAASGFFSCVTILITWTINNQESDAKKGTGVAILNIIGQLGPFIGTALYPKKAAPYYVPGMTACTIFMIAVAVLSLWLRRILQDLNMARNVAYLKLGDEADNGRASLDEGPDHLGSCSNFFDPSRPKSSEVSISSKMEKDTAVRTEKNSLPKVQAWQRMCDHTPDSDPKKPGLKENLDEATAEWEQAKAERKA